MAANVGMVCLPLRGVNDSQIKLMEVEGKQSRTFKSNLQATKLSAVPKVQTWHALAGTPTEDYTYCTVTREFICGIYQGISAPSQA